MRKNNHKFWLIIATLSLFCLNCGIVFAQVMDIEVVGGGYRLKGPIIIGFPDVEASFDAQTTTRDIRDLDVQDETSLANAEARDFILIEDQNGGNQFNVSVSAGEMTDDDSGISIANQDDPSLSGIFIRNADSNVGTANIIANNAQTSLSYVSLNADTDDFATLAAARTLFSSEGTAPGSWRIFPLLQVEIPANTPPGIYTTTLIFTIS